MTAAVRGMDMAYRAISDGIGFLQIQEAGAETTRVILQRMQQLATQMASGTYTDSDRSLAQVEIDALVEQIGQIAENTKFKKYLGYDEADKKIESFMKVLQEDTYQRKHETTERDEPVMKNRTGTTDTTEPMENKTNKNKPNIRTATKPGLQTLRE